MTFRNRRAFRRSALGLAMATALPVGAQVIVNGDGIYEMDANTEVTIDGKPYPAHFLDVMATGYRAKYTLSDVAVGDMSRGTLDSIDLETQLRGPVTSAVPLAVLGVPVLVTADTVIRDLPRNSVETLLPGDIVEVSGIRLENGDVEATLIRGRSDDDDDDEWKISGEATLSEDNNLFVGDVQIRLTDDTLIEDCDSADLNGQFIEVEAEPVMNWTPGDSLTAIEVECKDDRLDGPPDSVISAEIEGLISEVLSPDTFLIGDQEILVTPQTEFDNGSASNITVGVRAEVEGLLDTDTGVLTATEVEFREDFEIEISAPVEPDDLVPGESITMLGLTFTFAEDLEDDEGIAQAGLTQARQIELEGIILPDGSLMAVELEDDGEPQPSDIKLEGIVETIDAPLFTVLGITVDAAQADLEKSTGGNDEVLEIEADLQNTGVYPLGSGDAKYRERDDGTDFEIEIEDVPVGSYDFQINGVSQGSLEVIQTEDGDTEGELEFSDPPDSDELPLTFDPRGQLIEVLEGETLVFDLHFPALPEDNDCDDPSGKSVDDCDDEDECEDSTRSDDHCDDDNECDQSTRFDDDCDEDGGISIQAFFDVLQIGDRVEVEQATFNADTNTLEAGEIEIESEDGDDDDENAKAKLNVKGSNIGVGRGTVTGTDRLFGNSFE